LHTYVQQPISFSSLARRAGGLWRFETMKRAAASDVQNDLVSRLLLVAITERQRWSTSDNHLRS
jgi:hypothetical protein